MKIWTAALVVALLGILAGVVWYAVDTSSRGGSWDLPVSTWIFMIGGVIVAIGIGVGLMALIFWSNRKGHDEAVDRATDRERDRKDSADLGRHS